MVDGKPGANEKSSGPPRFASAALTTYASRLVVAALSFGSIVIIARALGPEGRGEVALLTTIAVVTSQLAILGIDEANVNFAGTDPARRPSLATNSVLFSILFGGLAIAVLFPLFSFFPGVAGDTGEGLRLLALAAIPGLILQTYLTFLIRGDYGFGVTNVAWVASPAITFAGNACFAAFGTLTVSRSFALWIAAHAAATVLLAWYVARRSAGFGRPDVRLARRALSFGSRSHVGRVMMSGNYRADQWFVGAIAGSRELGLYSIAIAWSEVLFYIPTVLVIVQRPFLVRAERSEARRRAAKGFRAGIALTIPLVVAGLVLAPFLCTTIFGSQFEGSIGDLRILLIGVFGLLALQQLGNALTAQGRPELWTAAAACAFATAVTLNLLLIPQYGGAGAAVASRAAFAIGGVVAIALFLRVFDGPARDLVPRPGEVPGYAQSLLRPLRRGR